MVKLIIDELEVKRESIIGGNVDIDKLLPCIQDSQLIDLEPIIGKHLYDKMVEDYDTGYSGKYKILYDDYIKPFLIRATVKNYLLIGAYTITNGGIYKHSAENTEGVTRSELDYIYKSEKSKCDTYALRLNKWLCQNRLPEWVKDHCSKAKPALGGWVFN